MGFWSGSQWRQTHAKPSSLTCPDHYWVGSVCVWGDSSTTSLVLWCFFPSPPPSSSLVSIINLKDPDCASDTICWRRWSTDLALAKSSTKNSSLYHYLDEVLILVSINMIMHCRRVSLGYTGNDQRRQWMMCFYSIYLFCFDAFIEIQTHDRAWRDPVTYFI